MNVEASINPSPSSISHPPKSSTTTMIMVPMDSDTGCAALMRIVMAIMPRRNSLLMKLKRFAIFSSAMNALTMRSPPSVSSICAMISDSPACTLDDWFFRRLVTLPITHAAGGATMSTKSVSCQLVAKSVMKQMMMAIGCCIKVLMADVTEFSTICMSVLILTMMSPLRSAEKKLSGKCIILLYMAMRMSLTTPVLSGVMMFCAPQ